MRPIGALLAAVAVALIVPSTALGASTRYAAPVPQGAEDCSSPANACSLKKAATDPAVADGDEVILAPGEYVTSEGIALSKAIDLHGQGPPSATRIVSSPAGDFGVVINKAGTKVHDLEIDYSGVFSALFASAGTVDAVIAVSTSASTSACGMSSATFLDSICVSTGSNGVGIGLNWSGGTHTVLLRNVTAIGAAANGRGITAEASGAATLSIDAKNVIARGGTAGDDVHAFADSTSSTTVSLDHSNYAKVFSFAQSGGSSSVTSSATNGNQTEAPTFVNPALGDYHEAAGSETIDAGVADASNGTLDIDDQPRTQGPAIDIGADEYVPPESKPPPDTLPPNTSILKHPAKSIRTRRKTTKATFRFTSNDPTAHYECALDAKPFAPCTSPRRLTVRPGHHQFRVRATDPAGNTDQTPAVFIWSVKRPPSHRPRP